MKIRVAIILLFVLQALCLSAQNLSRHYVSRGDIEGTIYHTMPVTLFSNSDCGDLTYDITYKSYARDTIAMATLNFTYYADEPSPAERVSIRSANTHIEGSVSRLYIEPERNRWKHRYTLHLPIEQLYGLYNADQSPEVVITTQSSELEYQAKRSAWREYAPIGYKIFEVIRLNDAR